MKPQQNIVTSEILSGAVWHQVIRLGFNAEVMRWPAIPALYCSIFQKGPFQLALLNFPTGLMSADSWSPPLQAVLTRELQSRGVQVLRLAFPDQGVRFYADDVLLPVTQIQNLQDWSLQQLDQDIRYKIRKSQRMGLVVRPASPADDQCVFQLYCNAVERHSGNLRYTQQYFTALIRMAQQQSGMQVLIAETPSAGPCGFIAVVHDGKFSHYLHGGFSAQHAALRPGYVLMSQAIETAQKRGAEVFDLMASPAEQLPLIRFKEKWGGTTYLQRTVTIPLGWMGRLLKLLLKLQRRIQS
ncbi:MAG: GNAT family N-acetyltransferase [Gammaproteobacteria bacterium]|nr:GNAT family N-acetyltransferase [Gammaproteobacteria bacterium]MBU2277567.1 GNAT family N-acetyltransferase [Gammaproteobacteria bacterium]